ncbi:MAG TPA: hypothetical protein VLA77_02290 [Candidatus Saccharimonadales bacterium]|nr:hypothetical protein [Candidatus Saccharimonadales bacterium]
MQKDVIYIDTEDDVTAIIGKVKATKNKIVALVPPKRIGVLQSAVNLKLLQKAAAGSQKHIVLITNEHSLVALAAGLSMPVAKNLQSKPEIPKIDLLNDTEEEVIDGESIPVGDFASKIGLAAAVKKDKSAADEISEKVDIGEVAVEAVKEGKGKVKSAVPNFNTFRKRFFLIGGGVLVLILFMVWAFVFAPRATVTITARTTAVNIDKNLKLDPSIQASDTNALLLKSTEQSVKKTVAVEFDATGTKEIGNKSSGTITIRNCDFSDDTVIPSGTKFTATGGQVFVSTQSVTVPDFTGPSSSCTQAGSESGKATVSVEATAVGPDYNIAAQAYSISGYSNKVDGVGSAMTGGTKETVKVVSQQDVDKAREQLPKPDDNAAKVELKQLFTADQIVINESFETSKAPEVVAPNVGEQATRAKLSQETTYKLTGVQRTDVDAILKQTVDAVLQSKSDQQAYSYGQDTIVFQTFQRIDDHTVMSRMVTTAYIGPRIDTNQLAQQLEGKRYGEIQEIVNLIPGVENVEINLSPFWVTKAPKAEKIDIKFSVEN